jgi:hypothetical protein
MAEDCFEKAIRATSGKFSRDEKRQVLGSFLALVPDQLFDAATLPRIDSNSLKMFSNTAGHKSTKMDLVLTSSVQLTIC